MCRNRLPRSCLPAAIPAAELDEVVATIRSAGGTAVAISADLTERNAPAGIVTQVKQVLGPVHTVMNDRRIAYDAQRLGVSFQEQETTQTLLGRRLEPDEIAPLAVYLASDMAGVVTGQAYNVCGGVLMAG